MHLQQTIDNLSKNYTILAIQDFIEFQHHGLEFMFDTLTKLKKDEYADNDRLVFIDMFGNNHNMLDAFVRLLTELDIPIFFVFVVTNSTSTYDFFNKLGINTKLVFEEVVDSPPITNKFINSNTVCVNPWINLEIKNNGQYSFCCEYNATSKLNVKENSLDDFVNSSEPMKVRQQMLDGEQPLGCSNCYQTENLGYKSKRLRDNYVFREVKNRIDLQSSGQLLSLDVKLGYTCNLACRICSENNSSKWFAEKSKNIKLFKNFSATRNIADWMDDTTSNFWEHTDGFNSVKYLKFTGGEPFLSKQHESLLHYFIDNGLSQNIYVHYNTNGTINPSHILEYAKQFKELEITLSLDNVADKFEYERGDKWSNVVSNVRRCVEYQANNVTFNIYSTVSIFNIMDMYEVFKFGETYNLNVEFSLLSGPSHFCVKLLPDHVKAYIYNKLTKIGDEKFAKKATPVLKYMMEDNTTPVSIKDFFREVELIDTIRKQNFSTTYAELNKLLRK